MLRAKTKKILSQIIKTVLVICSFLYLIYKLSVSDLSLMWHYCKSIFGDAHNAYYFVLVVLLMLLNWSIEAVKWKKLIQKLEPLSFFNALKSVLAGITISLVTPNRAGEFAGKIFYLRKANKADAMLLSIVGSLSQVLLTFCFGLFAFYNFFADRLKELINPNLFLGACMLIVIVSIFLFFNVKRITKSWKRANFIHKLIPYHPDKFNFSKPELAEILLLSLLRFITFSTQYFLLLRIFNLQLDASQAFYLIVLYFFFISLIPTYALSELGVRGTVALSLFATSGLDNASILASSLFLWIINLAIPAIIGSAFVFQLRFFKSEK